MTEKKTPEKKAPEKKVPAKKVAGPLEACSICGKKVSQRGMRGHVLFVHERKKSVANEKTEAPSLDGGEEKPRKESKPPASPRAKRDESPASKPAPSETKEHWWFRTIGGKK